MQSQLLMAGIDYHTASAAIREQFALSDPLASYRFLAEHLRAGEAGQDYGMALLSTCNRTELWISGNIAHSPFELLCSLKNLEPEKYKQYFTLLEGDAAARRLFRTATGLESLIKGENQIVAQIKEAMEKARQAGCLGSVLDRLFQSALACAKKIRTETGISRGNVSAARAAVSLIQKRCPPEASALVIGNGVIGGECARLLREAGFPVSVTIRAHKARADAAPPGCESVPYEDRYQALRRRRVIISATTSPRHTIAYNELKEIWDGRERLFLDLALPRDMEEDIKKLPGLTLLNLDDLEGEAGNSFAANTGDAAKIESILDASAGAFQDWLEYRGKKRPERAFFPFFMDISAKKALIIGGGHIALRRARKLVPFHCRITVRAPLVCDELRKLAEDFPETFTLENGVYRDGSCAGADFVLAATNDRAVNHAIREECRTRRIPVSVADRSEESDFFFPALVMEDNLIIGVVSSDGSHTKVKNAAEQIADVFKK
jgi:glutamyl-tRNA reductase